jgi:hypothetical protein
LHEEPKNNAQIKQLVLACRVAPNNPEQNDNVHSFEPIESPYFAMLGDIKTLRLMGFAYGTKSAHF